MDLISIKFDHHIQNMIVRTVKAFAISKQVKQINSLKIFNKIQKYVQRRMARGAENLEEGASVFQLGDLSMFKDEYMPFLSCLLSDDE